MSKNRSDQQPDADQGKSPRQDLVRRLRAALTQQPLTIPQMVETLGVDEAAVLVALRRLRRSGEAKGGKGQQGHKRADRPTNRLGSGMVAGQPCWWWKEDAPPAVPRPPVEKDS